jgi:hypothetical protein
MSATAFNRARRQSEALADAKARDNVAQNTPLNHKLDSEQMAEFARTGRDDLPKMASPPYPDTGRLINVPADANLEREAEAFRQSELNKTRVLTDEAREELQNSHWRDAKTKAIPDHDEAGFDRSQFGMAPLQEQAYADYEDPRSPTHDGRIRATEEYKERPDVDTTESKASRQAAPKKLAKDDDPKEVGNIIERGMAAAQKRIEADAAVALTPVTDPKEALEVGASKFADAPPPSELSEEPPAPAHTADSDMIPAPPPEETKPAPEEAPSQEEAPAPEEESKETGKLSRGRPRKSKED